MATTPNSIITSQTPRCTGSTVVNTSAVTARTIISGTTGLTLVSAAGANGTRFDKIRVKGSGMTVAGQLDFWIYDGTSSRLFASINVPVVTPSTTIDSFQADLLLDPLVLPSSHSIYFSSQVAAQLVHAFAFGGDF